MDTLSHGLWGGITVGRKSRGDYWIAFACGVLPDIIPFGWSFVKLLFGTDHRRFGPPDASAIPIYIHQLYNITHSLVVFGAIFAIVWLMWKKPYLPLLAWAFHILLDIPTHTTQFFPTPFLWPISNVHIDGISWGTSWIFLSNWVLLVVLYGYWIVQKRQKRSASKRLND